jgi:threonine/homoserine/homoserine lactone efflux protein
VATFLGLSLLLILTPGPNQALLTSRTLRDGRRGGLATVAGLTLGMALHVLAAVVGLSALLAASAELFAVVKVLGGAYLVALGLAALLAARRGRGPGPEAQVADAPTVPPRRAVLEGAASMALNPKVTVFFVAVAPQFVAPGPGASLRIALLLLLYGAMAFGFWVVWVLAVHRAQALVRRPAVHAWLQRATGTALCAFGLRLAAGGR